jgi:hypothetical protein
MVDCVTASCHGSRPAGGRFASTSISGAKLLLANVIHGGKRTNLRSVDANKVARGGSRCKLLTQSTRVPADVTIRCEASGDHDFV